MDSAGIIWSPNGRRLWVRGPDGQLAQSFRRDQGVRIALESGFTSADIEGAPVALGVIHDPLVDETRYDPLTGFVTEAAGPFERRELMATAWVIKELLEDPAHVKPFGYLVTQYGDDVCVTPDAAWVLYDRVYAPLIASPGVDAVRFHSALLSTGSFVIVCRKCEPARKFLALDLDRVWRVAAQFEQHYSKDVARWRGHQARPPVAEHVLLRRAA